MMITLMSVLGFSSLLCYVGVVGNLLVSIFARRDMRKVCQERKCFLECFQDSRLLARGQEEIKEPWLCHSDLVAVHRFCSIGHNIIPALNMLVVAQLSILAA